MDDTTPDERAEPVAESEARPWTRTGLFRALYFSIFVLFYRLGAKDSIGGSAFNGVAGITAVEGLLGMSVLLWSEILTGRRGFIERYVVLLLLAWVALHFINSHFLLYRGSGFVFDDEFTTFPKRKRMVLLLAAIAILLATGVIFYFAITTFHRTFQIDLYDYF